MNTYLVERLLSLFDKEIWNNIEGSETHLIIRASSQSEALENYMTHERELDAGYDDDDDRPLRTHWQLHQWTGPSELSPQIQEDTGCWISYDSSYKIEDLEDEEVTQWGGYWEILDGGIYKNE